MNNWKLLKLPNNNTIKITDSSKLHKCCPRGHPLRPGSGHQWVPEQSVVPSSRYCPHTLGAWGWVWPSASSHQCKRISSQCPTKVLTAFCESLFTWRSVQSSKDMTPLTITDLLPNRSCSMMLQASPDSFTPVTCAQCKPATLYIFN